MLIVCRSMFLALAFVVLVGATEKPQRDAPSANALSSGAIASERAPDVIRTKSGGKDCGPYRYRGTDELCAQWKAADASVEAARWSWWQLILSAVGAVGLGLTLWFNYRALRLAERNAAETADALDVARQNAEAASEAVAATKRANDISEETAQRRLRAYVNVESCEIQQIDGGYLLIARLTNCGQTPAYRVRIMGESFGAEYPLRIPNRGFIEVADGFETPLGPGQSHDAAYALRTEDPEQAMQQVLAGNVGLYIQGLCRYEDVFGHERETRFRYVFGGRPANSGGLVMHAAEMGNSST